MCGSAARIAYSVPFRFTSIISSRCSGASSRNGPYAPTPAFATTMSIPPKRSATPRQNDVERVRVAHVRRARHRTVEARDRRRPRDEPEVHAALVEHPRDRGADAAARAGDHCRLSFKAHAALQWSKCGIERLEALVTLVVGRDPGRVGVDPVAGAHATRHRIRRIGEYFRPHACQKGSAERGARVAPDALERDPEYRRGDLQPQVAARAAARDAPDRGLHPELPQQLERVPKPVGDALEHGPGERPAVVAEG